MKITNTFICYFIYAVTSLCLTISSSAKADILLATGTKIQRVDLALGFVRSFIDFPAKTITYDEVNKKIYFVTTANALMRADQNGGNITTLVADLGIPINDIAVDTKNSKLLLSSPGDASIKRANLDGTSIVDFIMGISSPTGIFVDTDSDKIYLASDFSQILSADLDGTNLSVLYNDFITFGTFENIFEKDGFLYWTDSTNNKILRSELDGSNVTALKSNLASVHGIAYDKYASNMFYVGAPSSGVPLYKSLTTGAEEEQVGGSGVQAYDIATNFYTNTTSSANTRMYVAVSDSLNQNSKIFWIDYRKQPVNVINNSNLNNPQALGYSEETEKIYWVDQITSTTANIRAARFDGANIETIASNISGKFNNLMVSDAKDKIYLTNALNKTIVSINRDSSTSPTVVEIQRSNIIHGVAKYGTTKFAIGDADSLYIFNPDEGRSRLETTFLFTAQSMTYVSGRHIYLTYEMGSPFLHSNIIGSGSFPYVSKFFLIKPTIIGHQSLNDKIFDVPHAIYLADRGSGTVANKLYVYIPDVLGISNGSLFPMLTLSSTSSITSFVDVPKEPVYPAAAPNPHPEVEGKTTVSGKIEARDVDGIELSPNGITVYFKKSESGESQLQSEEFSAELNTRITITDENGEFSFEDIHVGEYTLTFRREDLSFMTKTLTFNTDLALPTINASENDLTDTGCTTKDRTSVMLSIDNANTDLANFVLTEADALYTTSSKQSEISTAADEVRTAYDNVMSVSQKLPRVELKCNKNTICSKITYNYERKNYKQKSKTLKQKALKLMRVALDGQATNAVKKRKIISVNKKANKVSKIIKKLIKKSYLCELDPSEET